MEKVPIVIKVYGSILYNIIDDQGKIHQEISGVRKIKDKELSLNLGSWDLDCVTFYTFFDGRDLYIMRREPNKRKTYLLNIKNPLKKKVLLQR